MTIGDLLKKYREENKISMDEFSKKSSLSKGYISMLENNINPRNNKPIAPTLHTIKKIADGMDTDVDTLLKALDEKQEIALNDGEDIPMNMNTMDTFRKKMKERREKLNITLKEIAESIGVKEATVQRYESGNGIKSVPYDNIVKISEVLKCTPAYLMGWEELSQEETDELKPEYLKMARQLQKEGLTDDDFTKILQVYYTFKDK